VTTHAAASDEALARAVRSETAGIVTVLHRRLGDLDVAEEAVAEAVVEALSAWRRDGVPDRPGAWLAVAARRNAIDLLRHRGRRDRALERLVQDPPEPTADGADDRLPLLFGCCHPTLRPDARLALTLRAVLGLTTAQIARAFLVPEATAAQRIGRAKRRIDSDGISLRVPDGPEMSARLDDVLTVVQLLFNEGWLATGGELAHDRDLADDGVWLAASVADALPAEPEAWGLLALLTLQQARTPARFASDGSMVLLEQQDRSRWDEAAITRARGHLQRAARLGRTGRFQLMAAIAACHTDAPRWGDTDWLQILTLYDVLVRLDPSPVTHLNRAVALSQVEGADAALAAVDRLAGQLARYHLFHAVRAELLRRIGRADEARAADTRALDLTANTAEQQLLTERLGPAPHGHRAGGRDGPPPDRASGPGSPP
jgi:RNA polymerase sigma factor (sigma-70 family)